MEFSPKISVIIPCYNVAMYVEKAVNSILSQSYKNLEVWIIDDGSTDDTLEKIKAIKFLITSAKISAVYFNLYTSLPASKKQPKP